MDLRLGKDESASFWMSILKDFKPHGTEDLLNTSTENLNGFVYGIRIVVPESKTQKCVAHQIRNPCR
uniref:transposase n=1 Tax=Gelidibacter pelagius TaxID=2819985 RepID=UPI001F48F5EB|nr:transposase [Gelidibacter pelagius]